MWSDASTPILGCAVRRCRLLPVRIRLLPVRTRRSLQPSKLLFVVRRTMPFQLAPARQASKKLIAKLKPVWLGKQMRSIGRRASRIPLGPVITVVQTTGGVGSAVPYLQGFSTLVVSILQRADVSKCASISQKHC